MMLPALPIREVKSPIGCSEPVISTKVKVQVFSKDFDGLKVPAKRSERCKARQRRLLTSASMSN